MNQSAYIHLVDGSSAPVLNLEDLRRLLAEYREQLALTGKQLGWSFEEAGFPYSVETRTGVTGERLDLTGSSKLYRKLFLFVGTRATDKGEYPVIRVTLPGSSTHGDKGKALELCKHLGSKLKAEVHLFNGRIMYFNPRK